MERRALAPSTSTGLCCVSKVKYFPGFVEVCKCIDYSKWKKIAHHAKIPVISVLFLKWTRYPWSAHLQRHPYECINIINIDVNFGKVAIVTNSCSRRNTAINKNLFMVKFNLFKSSKWQWLWKCIQRIWINYQQGCQFCKTIHVLVGQSTNFIQATCSGQTVTRGYYL